MKQNMSKLVRDKIPTIIEESGKTCKWHKAGTAEYNLRLFAKMLEEVDEFREDPSVEEAADIYEVFNALLLNWDIDICDVIFCADNKKASRGSFKEGIVLDSVE